MKNYLKIILFLIVPQCLAFAQQITNLHQKIENGRIVITYDLQDNIGGIYSINVTAKNGDEFISPLVIAGDLNGVSPGKNKTIWWEPVLEGRELEGWQIFLIAEINIFHMIKIRSGIFEMGCGNWTSDCDKDEKPVHNVMVSSFYMSSTEVTQAQWESIMGSNPSRFKGNNLPVESVSWNDVQDFIQKLNTKTGQNYRLPTEAEWEYAARSGGASTGSANKYKYAGTNSNLSDYAWYDDDSNDKTHPVAQRKPNGLGLYDMSGNVWEWCSDWYDRGYYKSSPKRDPKGARSGSSRVLRGGSWGNLDYECRSLNRSGNYPASKSSYRGFRLAKDL